MKVVERITFLPNGGSRHILEFENGASEEKTYDVAPILFGPWPMKTANELGIKRVEHRYLDHAQP